MKNVLHCNENPIYLLLEKELRGLSPNFHIHMSVSDLFDPRFGPHIFLQQNRNFKETTLKIQKTVTRKGIARPQSRFLNSCNCERFIYS